MTTPTSPAGLRVLLEKATPDAPLPWRVDESVSANGPYLHIIDADGFIVADLDLDEKAIAELAVALVNNAEQLIGAAERVEELEQKLRAGLAEVDRADTDCPIRTSTRRLEYCPKCGASQSQNCGPNVSALDKFAKVCRQALGAHDAG